MKEKELADYSDEELLELAKKNKSVGTINATLIGLFIGIILYGVMQNNLGLFTLIPLFFIYKIANKKGHDSKDIEAELKQRNL